jgi:thiol-disulfide isomerase/thioredoxin
MAEYATPAHLRHQALRRFTLVCGFLALLPALAAQNANGPILHKPAPLFVRTDLNHKQLDLGSYRGKVVLLNFWATWCAPCQLEMPRFVQWQRQYGPSGLQVIGISMDDDIAPVRTLATKLRLNYPVAMGDENLGELYGGIFGLPVTYLIDRDGKIAAEHHGETDLSLIQAELKLLLSRR